MFYLPKMSKTMADCDTHGQEDARLSPRDVLKRTVALVALAAGGIATAAWMVFLGWALTTVVDASLVCIAAPPAQHATAARPQRPAVGYKQPSNLKEKPPKHS
jgi:hypothetical protein